MARRKKKSTRRAGFPMLTTAGSSSSFRKVDSLDEVHQAGANAAGNLINALATPTKKRDPNPTRTFVRHFWKHK